MVSRKALRFGALPLFLLALAGVAPAQHNNAQLLSTNSASITAPFTPFGNNVTFNKFGDDGSSCVLDASGVLIWVTSSGVARTIPDSALATPLSVSNSELLVWKNRFVDYDYYPNKPVASVSLYRLDADGILTETPVVVGGKDILDTPVLTTTTGSIVFSTTERVDNNRNEELPIYNRMDDMILRTYRLAFDGSAQRINQISRQIVADSLNYETTQVGPSITQLGFGSDGSMAFRFQVVNPVTLAVSVENDWMNGNGSTVAFTPAAEISSVVYMSNIRLVYYSGTYNEFNRNPATGNLVSTTPTAVAGVGGTPLNFPKVTRVGYDQYFYTFSTAPAPNGTVLTYRLSGSSGATLVRSSATPVAGLANAEVKAINPANGAAMLVRGDNVVWVHDGAPTFHVLPASSNLAEPMFVGNTEAVVWNNARSPVDGSGVRPLVDVRHFTITGGALDPSTQVMLQGLPGTPVAGAGPGRVVLDTPDITLDPDVVGWIFTTAEKTDSTNAVFRTYRLYGPDSDGDGLDNAEEAVLGTNPALADSDADGLSDYVEVRTTLTNPTVDDTDGDGLLDGQEVNLYSTDPLDPLDPYFIDSDGDGLTDGEEIFGVALWGPTNRDVADTDGDGLTDFQEIFTYSTDPNDPDTDGDGVTDGTEVNVLNTDPLNPSFGTNPDLVTNFADPLVNGVYTGLAFNSTGSPVAYLNVRVTNRGAFTGAETGVGLKGSFRGQFDPATGKHTSTPTGLPGVTGVMMQILPDVDGRFQIQGQFASPAGTQYFELRRAAYSRTTTTNLAGNYTFGATAGVGVTAPTGDLIGTVTVKADGKVTVKSYTPDNQTGTWSGTINFNGLPIVVPGPDPGLVPMFAIAASGRIVTAGNLIFRDIPGSSDFDAKVRMVRLPGIGSDTYVAGYDQTRDLEGSFLSSSVLLGVPSFPATTNNVLGIYSDGPVSGDQIVATWATSGQISTPRNNLFAFSGRYAKTTGLATATYSLTDAARNLNNARVATRAVPIQKQNRIAGHYHLPTGGGSFTFVENTGGVPPVVTTITPRGKYVATAGASYGVSILTPGAWTATVVDAPTWVTLDATAGTGDSVLTITVTENNTGLARTAQVFIAGQLHVIQQDYR